MRRNTVIETLDSLGDEFDTEKLIEKLLFIEKVEQGIDDADKGKLIDYKEVKQRLQISGNDNYNFYRIRLFRSGGNRILYFSRFPIHRAEIHQSYI